MAKKRKRGKKSVRKMAISQEIVTKKKKEDLSGLWIPAGIFVGFGFGFIYSNVPAGLFLGLGGGFVLMVLTKLLMKRR